MPGVLPSQLTFAYIGKRENVILWPHIRPGLSSDHCPPGLVGKATQRRNKAECQTSMSEDLQVVPTSERAASRSLSGQPGHPPARASNGLLQLQWPKISRRSATADPFARGQQQMQPSCLPDMFDKGRGQEVQREHTKERSATARSQVP